MASADDELQVILLSFEEQVQATLASDVSTSLNALLTYIARYGCSPSIIATGTFSFTNLNIVQDTSSLPRLTNGECSRLLESVSDEDLKSQFAEQASVLLPVFPGGIEFPDDELKCTPAFPFQTAADQRAVFAINGLKLSAVYTLFSRTAANLEISPSLDRNNQPPEISAPLNSQKIRAALQDALRLVVLTALRDSYGLLFSFPTSRLICFRCRYKCPFCPVHHAKA
jgi:hypothetical protein